MSTHLHRRLDDAQVRSILASYDRKELTRDAAVAQLGIKRTQFFALLQEYRSSAAQFSIRYQRTARARIPTDVDHRIRKELETDRALIGDPAIPLRTYNYSAIHDALAREDIVVSTETIRQRAKRWGFWIPKPPRRLHDRIVTTDHVGALVQHDSSHHRWSPLISEMWYGITSIDDCSRLLLYADLWERETSWSHIIALKEAILRYGIPLRYYVDNHGIFRFIERRDSMGALHTVGTDEADPQWKRVLHDLSVDVTYALSPQAKGKIERPYRWMQDRVVRRCAREAIQDFSGARRIFREEMARYNDHQVHSTTGEIPVRRFARLRTDGSTVFRPFAIPKPFTHRSDIFCFREERVVNGYRKIAFHGLDLSVPNLLPRQAVELRYAPSEDHDGVTEIRMWYRRERLVEVTSVPTAKIQGVRF